MARVLYDGKRLIPAPLVSISKSFQKSGDGEIIGTTFSLTLTGTIVAYMGSPDSTGTFWEASDYPPDEDIAADSHLGSIQRKQEAIRWLFRQEGKQFEIQSSIVDDPVRCNPRIIDINFQDGIWFDRCDYTISLECDQLVGGPFAEEDAFAQYLSDVSEDWSIDTNEEHAEDLNIPKTYSVSHTISANGKRFYDSTGALVKEPWLYAKEYVQSRVGYDANLLASGIHNLPSYYSGLNHARNESINKKAGSYSLTETWLVASGLATEVFSVSTTDALDSPYANVSIEGTVTGYDQRDSNLNLITSKWSNAEDKFASIQNLTFIRAQQFSGLTLNIDPVNETIGRNPIQGTINYSYEYNTRPITLISGVRSEVISIQDNLGGQLHAEVFVLGRASRGYGPVLQDLQAKPANKRSLNIELVLDPIARGDRSFTTIKNLFNNLKPSVNPLYSGSILNVIAAANPINNGFTTVFQEQPQETWDITEFRYSYSTVWTFE